MKHLKNQKGYALIDLVVSLPFAMLAFVLLTLAILNFITTYKELSLFAQLQDELYSCVETIRVGYSKETVTGNPNNPNREGLIGALSAKIAKINDSQGKSVTFYPSATNKTYWGKFYWNSKDNAIYADGTYGPKYFNNVKIFPSGQRKIGNDDQFEIVNVKFSNESRNTQSNEVYLLGLDIEARVRFRERKEEQSVEEDIERNTKTIRYNTKIFIGNSVENY